LVRRVDGGVQGGKGGESGKGLLKRVAGEISGDGDAAGGAGGAGAGGAGGEKMEVEDGEVKEDGS